MDKKRVWVITIATEKGFITNRVFTKKEDAERYAKDYNEYALFEAKVETRKLNNHYIDWEKRHK